MNHLALSKTANRCTKRNLKFGIIAGFALLIFSSLAQGDNFSVSPTEPWPKPQPMRGGPPTAEEILRQLKSRSLPTLGLPATGIPASLSLNTVRFEFASAQLKPESIETLRNLGNALNQELKDEKVFVIEGHTDAVGTRQYNAVLSDRRAEAVKDYLVREMGVSPDRLRIVAKGSSDPADPKHPYAAENRRVVVINLGD